MLQINSEAKCEIIQLDLSCHTGVETFAKEIIQPKVRVGPCCCWRLFSLLLLQLASGQFQQGLFISNAGTLSPLGRIDSIAASMTPAELSTHMDINLTCHLWLSSFMAAAFQKHIQRDATIVNISSLAAVQPLSTWGAYCSHKAARDMSLAVAAAEGSQPGATCSMAYLNWAPGPMDGNMQEVIRTHPAVDPALRQWSSTAKAEGTLVHMADSAHALCRLLSQETAHRTWKSGAHVDYFDDEVQALLKPPTSAAADSGS